VDVHRKITPTLLAEGALCPRKHPWGCCPRINEEELQACKNDSCIPTHTFVQSAQLHSHVECLLAMLRSTLCLPPCAEWDAAEEDQEDAQQWDTSWDDDSVEDNFSKQLRCLPPPVPSLKAAEVLACPAPSNPSRALSRWSLRAVLPPTTNARKLSWGPHNKEDSFATSIV
jgi:hypothetical protein